MAEVKIVSALTHEPDLTETMAAFYSNAGAGVSAGNVKVLVQRPSDGKCWDFGTSTWQLLPLSAALTEVDAVNMPGLYARSIDWSVLSPVSGAEADFNVYVSVPTVPVDYAVVLKLRQGLSTLTVADSVVPTPAASPTLTMGELMTALMVFVRNNQFLDDIQKQQIFYKADGVTPAMTFDCKDAAGLFTIREVFKKERV